MMDGRQLDELDVGPSDIEHVVRALLDSISRGELAATAQEVEFLSSIVHILSV